MTGKPVKYNSVCIKHTHIGITSGFVTECLPVAAGEGFPPTESIHSQGCEGRSPCSCRGHQAWTASERVFHLG